MEKAKTARGILIEEIEFLRSQTNSASCYELEKAGSHLINISTLSDSQALKYLEKAGITRKH